MSHLQYVDARLECEEDRIKNGPSVIGASTPRLGPNHLNGVADMNFTARPQDPHSPTMGGV